jgi:putative transposase
MPIRKLKFKNKTCYHVVNRGFEKMKIFKDLEDYNRFDELIFRYIGGVEIAAYSVAVNHYHFLLEQVKLDGLERFISSVQKSYVRYFNKKYRRRGGLYEGRFWAEEIVDDDHYYNVLSYILRNPGKHKMTNLGMDGRSGARLVSPDGPGGASV